MLEINARNYYYDQHDNRCDVDIFDECDNKFKFCLRGSGSARDGNTENCPLGYYSTGEIGDNNFTFGSESIARGVPNPMTFTGTVWPVRSSSNPDSIIGNTYKRMLI